VLEHRFCRLGRRGVDGNDHLADGAVAQDIRLRVKAQAVALDAERVAPRALKS
jgi:hypothetical protein